MIAYRARNREQSSTSKMLQIDLDDQIIPRGDTIGDLILLLGSFSPAAEGVSQTALVTGDVCRCGHGNGPWLLWPKQCCKHRKVCRRRSKADFGYSQAQRVMASYQMRQHRSLSRSPHSRSQVSVRSSFSPLPPASLLLCS